MQELFEKFSSDGQKLTLLEFVDFLQEEQKEGERASDLALELIDRYEPSESGKRTKVVRHHTWGPDRGTKRQLAFCLTKGKFSPTQTPSSIIFILFNHSSKRRKPFPAHIRQESPL